MTLLDKAECQVSEIKRLMLEFSLHLIA